VEQSNPVGHVRLLAGSLTNGRLTRVDTRPLAARRYLLVVGDAGVDGYFTSLGDYGIYAVHGRHAYRTCHDFGTDPDHQVRRGVTTVRGLTQLFSTALHRANAG
jgi:hypothetical protein